MHAEAIETPTGKSAGDENFPVGSMFLPARLRPHVAAFYAFARAADDIADNPDLTAADKIARLDRFEAALLGRDEDPALAKVHLLRASLAATGVTARHGVDLLAAFKQDAVKPRYADWADLMGYCELSANPVGRYLLDLHGEARSGYSASDALCSALQVLNHLQDVGSDYLQLNRVYLPQDWLAAEGLGVNALGGARTDERLRLVLDHCLDATDVLLRQAVELPDRLTSLRLAMESAAIVRLAQRLSIQLRRGDPLAERLVAPKWAFVLHAALGAGAVMLRRCISKEGRLRAAPPG